MERIALWLLIGFVIGFVMGVTGTSFIDDDRVKAGAFMHKGKAFRLTTLEAK